MSPTKVNRFENLFSFVTEALEELKKFIVTKGLENAKHL